MRGIVAAAAALSVALVAPATGQAHAQREYYVSLGDSYASGYQPTHGSTRHGYANQLVPLARKRGHRYRLVNFGCSGATTTSIIRDKGCSKEARAVGSPRFRGRTQAGAAARFLRRHRGRIGLVTVAIGGNDVTACARAAEPIPCVADAVTKIKANVATLLKRVRRAAGRKVRIVGLTYPDVILGQWVRQPVNQDLARLSIVAFKELINPALRDRYRAVHARFVDVTAATGAYDPLTETTTLAPFGTIPVPVAKVCTLTYYCQLGDIHPRTAGYRVIAKLIAKTLPRRR